jgi:hypothetical protein
MLISSKLYLEDSDLWTTLLLAIVLGKCSILTCRHGTHQSHRDFLGVQNYLCCRNCYEVSQPDDMRNVFLLRRAFNDNIRFPS